MGSRINPIEWYKRHGWYVTSPYGYRTGKYAGFHRGIDLGGHSCGAPVATPFAGKVVTARTSGMGTWGHTVCIALSPDYKHVSLNAHLQSISVKEGQYVETGDIIGTNGGTNHSGGNYKCHIHYEILKNNGSAPWRGDVWGDPQKFTLTQKTKEPSDRFQIGDKIKNKTRGNIRVREEPNTHSEIQDFLFSGEIVIVEQNTNNGIYASGFYWWKIDRGWIAEDFFDLITTPDPVPIVPPEIEDKQEKEKRSPLPNPVYRRLEKIKRGLWDLDERLRRVFN